MLVEFEALATALQGLTRKGGLRVSVLSSSTLEQWPGPASAEALYGGDSHRALMQGVATMRAAAGCVRCSTSFVSAKYGVVDGSQEISGYSETFSGYQQRAIRKRAQCLGIPESARAFLLQEDDLKLVLLPNDYFFACAWTWPEPAAPTVVFASARLAERIPDRPRLVVVPTGAGKHRNLGCSLSAERGELARRLLTGLAEDIRPFGDVRFLDVQRGGRAWLGAQVAAR